MPQPTAPTPLPGESQPDFFDRCFVAVAGDTEDRNAVCQLAWRAAKGGDPVAAKKFAAGEYIESPDHVVWAEHVGDGPPDAEGNPTQERYDRDKLVAIINRNNHRIKDTADFAPISDGHTPERDELMAGAKEPELLGYAGNFRLGKIGNVNPRYAILCDEYHRKDRADVLKAKPRRSVEVWLKQNVKDRYLDPIAALGTITPRLDMGYRCAQLSDGTKVAKYAYVPGASNTSIPNNELEKEQYMLSPEEKQALVAEITQGVVAALKEATTDPAADPAAPPAADPTMPEQFRQYMSADDEEGCEKFMQGMDDDEDAKAQFSKYMEEEADEDEKGFFSKVKSRHSAKGEVAKYRQEASTLRSQYAQAQREIRDVKEQLALIKSEKLDAIKKAEYAKLREEGYLFNEAKEMTLVSKYSQEQFEAHVNNVVRANYGKIPDGRHIDTSEKPAEYASDERKSRYASLEAANRYEAKVKAGEKANYDQILADVKKEQGIAA